MNLFGPISSIKNQRVQYPISLKNCSKTDGAEADSKKCNLNAKKIQQIKYEATMFLLINNNKKLREDSRQICVFLPHIQLTNKILNLFHERNMWE